VVARPTSNILELSLLEVVGIFFFIVRPHPPNYIKVVWPHYTDTSELVVGYGANNMVTV
jgi:hypothetical protein